MTNYVNVEASAFGSLIHRYVSSKMVEFWFYVIKYLYRILDPSLR
jgi:hypothetical protein